MGYSANKFYHSELPVTGDVADVGEVLQIGYRSKKWDKKNENYLHEFEQPAKMYLLDDKKSLLITPCAWGAEGITQ